MTTLVVTNDFPPRRGGIESFVLSLCQGLAPHVVVYTAAMRGSAAVDETLGWPVVRDPTRILLPTPTVARRVQAAARQFGCDRVVFGAAAPLGLLARGLRGEAAVRRMVGLTHGHEVWWARVPGSRDLLRRIGADVDVLTYVSDFCRRQIAPALDRRTADRMVRLAPGVDCELFQPATGPSPLRTELGIAADQPVVLSASRLVRRKGQDVLLHAWPRVLADHPRAVLLVAGGGPALPRLRLLAARLGVGGSVRFLPGVPWDQMPEVYAAADVFALPCRTRLGGLEPEALGIVFLEAAACGLPVVVGASGGAPETVVDGVTGFVVDPRDPAEVAERIRLLVASPSSATEIGRRGRQQVCSGWSADQAVQTLRTLLELD